MKAYPKTVLTTIWAMCISLSLWSQDAAPYHLAFKRELAYVGGGVVSLGLSEILRHQVPDRLATDLNLEDINSFDRRAVSNSSEQARQWSTHLLYASVGSYGSLLLGRKTRRDFGKVSILFFETMAITGGITNITKAVFQRPRPYVFAEDWDPKEVLTYDNQASFISGHTSGAAAGTFFCAKVFSDYYPDSKLKPFVWGAAISIPAITGYLRIQAGRHYPTDVIAGYLVGAGIGIVVPTLHKKPISERKLTIAPTGNGVYVGFRF